MELTAIFDNLFVAGQILALAGLVCGIWLCVMYAAGNPDEDSAKRKRNPGDWEM